jgi:hypothetical protein
MPFVSAAQRGYLHAHPEILGKKGLAEWDAASKGQHVPEHVHHDLSKHAHKSAPYKMAREVRKE